VQLATTIEILGVGLAVSGNLLINFRNRSGYLAWIAANALLFLVSLGAGLRWMAGLYVVFTLLAIDGFTRWGKTCEANIAVGRYRSPPSVEQHRSGNE
jgi:nicotinamide riboside transporter PnuC